MSESLNAEELNLLHAAEETIRTRFAQGRHHVAAALRTASGQVFTGLHLDSAAIDICAEAVALGAAMVHGIADVRVVVAVQWIDGSAIVLPPCGTCRELFLNFAPHACAIIPVDGELVKLPFLKLTPCSYTSVRHEILRAVIPRSSIPHL